MVAAATFTFLPPGWAQQNSPTKLLTLDLATKLAQESLAACQQSQSNGAGVDTLNMPKVLLRDDGAPASSTETAQMKATTAILYDRPSGPRSRLLPAQLAARSHCWHRERRRCVSDQGRGCNDRRPRRQRRSCLRPRRDMRQCRVGEVVRSTEVI